MKNRNTQTFLGNVLVLAGGSALSRGLMVLVLPVLTRLYSPDDFSVLAVYTSVLLPLAVVACLRFDVAIPIAKSEGDAANIMVLGLCVAFIFFLVTSVGIYFFSDEIVSMTGQPAMLNYVWLWPVGILLASWYNGFQYWATRKERFSDIARTRLTQAFGGVATQIGFGALSFAPVGLLLGYLVSVSAGVLSLGRRMLQTDSPAFREVSIRRMRRTFIRYDRFPKFSSLEAFLNSTGMQLPVLLIAAFAAGPEAGFLFLVLRAMGGPISMIGAAVGQVYLSRAPHEYRSGKLDTLTTEILTGLIKSGVGPLIFAAIVAEPLFALVFGEDWRRAGELVPWLAPWFILQYLSSPVSPVMQVTERQKTMLMIVFLGLIVRVGFTLLGVEFAQSNISELYGIGSMIYYGVVCMVVYRVAGVSILMFARAANSGLLIVLAWAAAGVLVRGAFAAIN